MDEDQIVARGARTWIKMSERAFLAVLPNSEMWSMRQGGHVCYYGAIYRSLQDFPELHDDVGIWGRQIGPQLDFTLPRMWLSFCRQIHGELCMAKKKVVPVVENFKVIDCAVDPPAIIARSWLEPYVALSYVWGSSQLEHSWPRVIQDAVEVTRGVGFRHLWVDRYCIDQNNPVEKDYLISRMTAVYAGAELTIIAAAGSDASVGLPGVGTTPRRPQPECKVPSSNGGFNLVSIMRDPKLTIRSSVWNSRGWTYQEGVLSARRLVFTPRQVYWECGCLTAQETVSLPLSLLHIPNDDRNCCFRKKSPTRMNGHFMRHGIFGDDTWQGEMPFTKPEVNSSEYIGQLINHMRSYSLKDLTYDSDSLQAFQGIFESYCSRPNSVVKHILGIPVLTRTASRSSRVPVVMCSFAIGLCDWAHRFDLLFYDYKYDSRRPESYSDVRRHTHLPSWTWAGWRGELH